MPCLYIDTMPTYEYECKSCGHNFEAFQSMSDNPLSECPQCGKELRRLINGGGGVIFKGSGFYVNDKNKGNTKTASSKAEGAGPKETPDGKTGNSDKSGGSSKQPGGAAPSCASCPASSGGSCPAADKAAG